MLKHFRQKKKISKKDIENLLTVIKYLSITYDFNDKVCY